MADPQFVQSQPSSRETLIEYAAPTMRIAHAPRRWIGVAGVIAYMILAIPAAFLLAGIISDFNRNIFQEGVLCVLWIALCAYRIWAALIEAWPPRRAR